MITLAKQAIDFYIKFKKTPNIDDLQLLNPSLTQEKFSIFVTLYKWWEIVGSSWWIRELQDNCALEVINNSVEAFKDSRFENTKNIRTSQELHYRIDKIILKDLLDFSVTSWLSINPTNNWIIAIKNDYSKAAVILPNISPLLVSWDDLKSYLEKKLNEKIIETEYKIIKIWTQTETSF